MTQAQSLCNSDSDICALCMQKKIILCAQICSSGAAEEASENVYVLIELTNDLQII